MVLFSYLACWADKGQDCICPEELDYKIGPLPRDANWWELMIELTTLSTMDTIGWLSDSECSSLAEPFARWTLLTLNPPQAQPFSRWTLFTLNPPHAEPSLWTLLTLNDPQAEPFSYRTLLKLSLPHPEPSSRRAFLTLNPHSEHTRIVRGVRCFLKPGKISSWLDSYKYLHIFDYIDMIR